MTIDYTKGRAGGIWVVLGLTLGFLVPTIAAADVVTDAEQLVASGKAQAAFDLLAPQEFDFAGNPKFDLLFGYAALESGNPSLASLAFERVLAVEPNNPEARLHLARAYYALNDPSQAQREFETLLAANPPQAIRDQPLGP